jgi:hypothetical protein
MYRCLHKRSTNLSAMLGREVGNFGNRPRQTLILLASPVHIVDRGITSSDRIRDLFLLAC